MPYLIHPLSEGKFEIIDADFAHLYDLDPDELFVLSDDEYQAHLGRANHLTTFKDGKFIYRDEVIDPVIIKAQQQAQVWEQIKAKRHSVTRGGVLVKSANKWFHTDDSSRTQYLALQILPEPPKDLMWKTMDNSFVKLDKALITELAMTILQNEQADFANAERHRAAMMKVDNPLDYDYSDGWSACYDCGNKPAIEQTKQVQALETEEISETTTKKEINDD